MCGGRLLQAPAQVLHSIFRRKGMKAKESYCVGIYLRLSRDDEDMGTGVKTESNSIGSQRELALSFVRRHEDMEIHDIYIDM